MTTCRNRTCQRVICKNSNHVTHVKLATMLHVAADLLLPVTLSTVHVPYKPCPTSEPGGPAMDTPVVDTAAVAFVSKVTFGFWTFKWCSLILNLLFFMLLRMSPAAAISSVIIIILIITAPASARNVQ